MAPSTRRPTRLLLRGGRVLTPAGYASALLVEGDAISWVGDEAELLPEEVDRTVDLGGRLVTPAFVDAHVHLAETGLAALGVDLSEARSAAEALDLVADHARSADLGVVLGMGWDDTRWAAGAPFTRAELDRAVGGRPAYVARVDLHSACVSTALLEVATGHLGGRLEETSGWSADGPVSRDAHHAVRDALRTLLTPDDRAAAISRALRTAATRGIGMVHEMAAPHINPAGDVDLARWLRAQARDAGGALPEVVGYWGEVGGDLTALEGVAGAAGDICVDGAVGSRTAGLEAPYTDAASTNGHVYLTADQVADHVVACTEAGLQAGFHVIGDRAVAEVVAGLEKAASQLGDDAVRRGRHRLEHLEMVTPPQMDVLAGLGVTASMQPLFQEWWGGPGGLYEIRLGERARGMNAFGSLAAAGVPLAFGSDSPVTPFAPWSAVRGAATHQDASQRLGVRAAFEAHTVGGWRAARDDTGGEITAGAPANLAVWDTTAGDPLAHLVADAVNNAAADASLPHCVLTLVRGAVAHDEEGTLS
ncbi:MAG: hypothetical protein QOK15_3443 [Nocardioidaceae bacterium]|nr:hypothetical protein [Nocardioidaceae bacterium]